MGTKIKYEPPFAKDLSCWSASGQSGTGGGEEPLGTCSNGYYPYADCSAGTDVGGTSQCIAGPSPDSGDQCRPWGSQADSNCSGGGYQ